MLQDIYPYRLINHYDPEKTPGKGSVIMHFKDSAVLLKKDSELGFFHWEDALQDKLKSRFIYLFTLKNESLPNDHSLSDRHDLSNNHGLSDDHNLSNGHNLSDEESYFLYMGESCPVNEVEAVYTKVRSLRTPGKWHRPAEHSAYALDALNRYRHLIFASYTAYQLYNWYRDNRYCGRCGKRTLPHDTERAIYCPECGRMIYPRILPAVIVGVINGDKILMTKYADRYLPFYALIAGFTEIGETLEQTVEREVMEEAGIRIKNIRYYKSQPWGIDDDILSGFYCDVDGNDTLHVDNHELKEAIWVDRKDVVGQPNDFSLTNEMMLTFRDGKEPA